MSDEKTEYHQRLPKLLTKGPLPRALWERLKKVRKEASEESFNVLTDWDLFTKENFSSILQKSLFAELPKPHSITEEEALEMAKVHLSGVTDNEEFKTGFTRFAINIYMAHSKELSSDRFDFGWWARPESDDAIDVDEGHDFSIWQSESGLGIYVRADDNHDSLCDFDVTGCVYGRCTRPALEAAAERIKNAARCIINCINLVRERTDGRDWIFGKLPPLESLYADETQSFLAACMSCYINEPRSGDNELSRRLSNAIELLILADQQDHKGLALSLCFSAIESLICACGGNLDGDRGLAKPYEQTRRYKYNVEGGLYERTSGDIRSTTRNGGSI